MRNNFEIKLGKVTKHKTKTRVVHQPLALPNPLRFLMKGNSLIIVKKYD